MIFVVDRVALGQVSLRVLRFSSVGIIPPWLFILVYCLGDEVILSMRHLQNYYDVRTKQNETCSHTEAIKNTYKILVENLEEERTLGIFSFRLGDNINMVKSKVKHFHYKP
jgi:hypothetical protein